MTGLLSSSTKRDLLERGFTRRAFGRIATVLTAGASLPFYNEAALAQLSAVRGHMPPDAVRINANENPLGPCPEAAEAIHNIVQKGGRYLPEESAAFARTAAEVLGLKPEYAVPFAGSSDPLHRAVLAFCSPSRGLVVADPGYEAAGRVARFLGARVSEVPLAKDYSHDVRAMVKADPNAGLLYLCNPNNPTGTVTSRADVEYALAHKPAGSVLLIDEAYIHFSDATPSVDLVAADKEMVILRTFSKIYGMAGLRAGLALGRPDLLGKVLPFGPTGYLPVTAMAGGAASLRSKTVVPERKRLTRTIREDVFDFLEKHRFSYVPSVSNKFMLNAQRPAQEVIQGLAAQKVFVGRVWPSWPTHVRVSIGTKDDMEKFKAALLKVMG